MIQQNNTPQEAWEREWYKTALAEARRIAKERGSKQAGGEALRELAEEAGVSEARLKQLAREAILRADLCKK